MALSDAEKALHARLRAGADRARDAAFPIYGTEGSRTRFLGSGFILSLRDRNLLITASHVFQRLGGHTPFLPFVGVELGPAQTFLLPEPYDVAIMPLPKELELKPGSVRVVTVSDLATRDDTSETSIYCFAGFPFSKNKSRGGRKFNPHRFSHMCRAAGSGVYQTLGLDPKTFLALGFDRGRAVNNEYEYVTPPVPRGMSGGPVWRLAQLIDGGLVDGEALVAIALEWREDLKAVVAIRTSFLLALLERNVPELADELAAFRVAT